MGEPNWFHGSPQFQRITMLKWSNHFTILKWLDHFQTMVKLVLFDDVLWENKSYSSIFSLLARQNSVICPNQYSHCTQESHMLLNNHQLLCWMSIWDNGAKRSQDSPSFFLIPQRLYFNSIKSQSFTFDGSIPHVYKINSTYQTGIF